MNDRKAPGWVRKIESESDTFFEVTYPSYTPKQKVSFWVDELQRTIRLQGESTGDEYSAFSKNWYQKIKSWEPDFDKLLEQVFPLLGDIINKKRFYNKIKKSTDIDLTAFGLGKKRKPAGLVAREKPVKAYAIAGESKNKVLAVASEGSFAYSTTVKKKTGAIARKPTYQVKRKKG